MKHLSKALVGALLALTLASPASAQQAQWQTQPLPRATTDASSTITVTNTFQQLWASQGAPQGPIRSACSIQNNGTHTMWVFAGALASATKTSSMVLPPGAIYHCGQNEVVGTSAISLTGTATDAFTASLEGAPTVIPASPAEGGGGVPTDVNLAQVGGATVTLGQKTTALSIPVTLPSDATAFLGYSSPRIATLSTTVTRPGDTAAYAANDAYANSTSAPTVGGFTLTGACAASGGNGELRSAQVSASAGTLYSGEIWVFDQAVTAVNDNAPLDVSDSDILNRVAVIPFATTDVDVSNSTSYVSNIGQAYTCVGTANLRFLVKILTAITPGNAEVLALRVTVQN